MFQTRKVIHKTIQLLHFNSLLPKKYSYPTLMGAFDFILFILHL